jgi:hypothetical protein
MLVDGAWLWLDCIYTIPICFIAQLVTLFANCDISTPATVRAALPLIKLICQLLVSKVTIPAEEARWLSSSLTGHCDSSTGVFKN